MDASTPETAAQVTAGYEALPFQLIKDHTRGLTWAPTLLERMTFVEAEQACAELQIDGQGGFRLPTIEELETLRDRTRFAPATHELFVSDTQNGFYWSSTPGAESPADFAWGVDFCYGVSTFDSRYYCLWVRPVRASQ